MSVYYPPVGFHFKVEFPGITQKDADTRFQEVAGLSAELTTEELMVGGENRFAYKLPARSKYGNLVLKRGMLADSGLISWFTRAFEDFEFKPVDVEVHLLNENHDVNCSWTFLRSYPVKWMVSDLKAQDSAIVVETIELAYQYFRKK